MNVLIVTNNLPYPPTSGGEIRTHGIAEGLHRAGHDITVLCYDTPQSQAPSHIRVVTVPPPPPRSKLKRLQTLLTTQQPDLALRRYSNAMARQLATLLAETHYDLIQFEGIESAVLLPHARRLQPSARIAFDTFNAEYALQRSIFEIDRRTPRRWPAAFYSYLQIERIRRYEKMLCETSDVVFAVSEEDAALLQPLAPPGRIHVLNSGIWVDRYTASEAADLGQHALVFTGSMDYRPNVDAALWFANDVFPSIRSAVPDARFVIVGKDPHPRLQALAEVDGIAVTGRVESALPYLHGAAVFVVPLRMGSGTRLKLLEAMAAGCAIVATQTASTGLNAAARSTMWITDSVDAMAEAIVTLLTNPAERDQLRTDTQRIVRDHYDWSVLIPRLQAAYQRIGLNA